MRPSAYGLFFSGVLEMSVSTSFKVVVLSADGSRILFSPAEFAQVRLLPGTKIGVVDERTGKSPKSLVARKLGKDLLLELPEHGLLARVDRFDDVSDLVFVRDINTPSSSQDISSASTQAFSNVPVDLGAGAGQGAATSAASILDGAWGRVAGGFSLSTLGIAIGGLALAAGGGGGGGSSNPGLGGPSC
jgi:hypothetical protein